MNYTDKVFEQIREQGHVIWQEGSQIIIKGNYKDNYDSEAGTFSSEVPIDSIEGEILEIDETKMVVKKEKGLRITFRQNGKESSGRIEYEW